MNNWKTIIMTCVYVILVCLLCACGGTQSTPTEASAPEPAQTETAPAVPEATPAEEASVQTEAEPEAETNTAASNASSGEPSGERSASGGMSGGTNKSGDAELQAMIAEVAPQFDTDEYYDEETGLTLEYNVFLPEGFDGTGSYPMVVFIPDSSVVGRGAEAVLTQGWGALIWATEEEQAKHPCVVIAPVFTEVILDDHNGFVTTDWVYLVPRMVDALAQKYSADTDRIYATGQSMGCMTMLITASANPELFAAELFVDGQWDITTLTGLESQTFFYIAAGGDDKAVGGQDEVMAMLDADDIPYSYSEGWDAQADAGELAALVQEELADGNTINFVRWKTGTVLNGSFGMEHMASFDYAYKLETVRDWLFEQSR